jgi:hypothetical protein
MTDTPVYFKDIGMARVTQPYHPRLMHWPYTCLINKARVIPPHLPQALHDFSIRRPKALNDQQDEADRDVA